jgi:hypothetical protein
MLYCHANHRRSAGGESRPVFTLWCALIALALLAQSFVIQAHFHGPADTVSSGAVASTIVDKERKQGDRSNGADDTCLICREAGSAGLYLLPPATLYSAAVLKEHWPRLLRLTELFLPRPPLGWLGRAPPR